MARDRLRRGLTHLLGLLVAAMVVLGPVGAIGVATVARGVEAAPAPEATSGAALGVVTAGEAVDDQGKPGSWNCARREGYPNSPDWYVSNRFGDWSPDNGALGASLPDGFVAAISSRVQARQFRMVLYSPYYGDLIVEERFSEITPETGTTLPTGRFDPIGEPKLFYDRGQLKILIGLWGGGGGATDKGGRIYTWCGIVPGTP